MNSIEKIRSEVFSGDYVTVIDDFLTSEECDFLKSICDVRFPLKDYSVKHNHYFYYYEFEEIMRPSDKMNYEGKNYSEFQQSYDQIHGKIKKFYNNLLELEDGVGIQDISVASRIQVYPEGGIINEHKDGYDSYSLSISLTDAPETKDAGGKLIASGNEIDCKKGRAVVMDANKCLHEITKVNGWQRYNHITFYGVKN